MSLADLELGRQIREETFAAIPLAPEFVDFATERMPSPFTQPRAITKLEINSPYFGQVNSQVVSANGVVPFMEILRLESNEKDWLAPDNEFVATLRSDFASAFAHIAQAQDQALRELLLPLDDTQFTFGDRSMALGRPQLRTALKRYVANIPSPSLAARDTGFASTEHTDPAHISAILQLKAGLVVYREGRWIPTPENSLVLFAGEYLATLTDGQVAAAPHGVTTVVGEDRYSIAAFRIQTEQWIRNAVKLPDPAHIKAPAVDAHHDVTGASLADIFALPPAA